MSDPNTTRVHGNESNRFRGSNTKPPGDLQIPLKSRGIFTPSPAQLASAPIPLLKIAIKAIAIVSSTRVN